MKDYTKKQKILIVLGLTLFILIGSGITYAALTWATSNPINIGLTSGCFEINYTPGGAINNANVEVMNESTLINGSKFTITDGIALTYANIGIKSTCTIEGYGSLYLNVTNLSNAFSTGSSKGSLKYAILNNTSSVSTPSVTNLKGQSFDIVNAGSITATGITKIFTKQLTTTQDKYLIVFYIDNSLVGNDVIGSTFAGNISADAKQLVDTPDYCFPATYDTSNKTAAIVGYNCHKNNNHGYEPITDAIKIPSYIKGIKDISLKSKPTDEAKKDCALYLPFFASKFNLSITSEQAKTLCNGGTVNGKTLKTLITRYQKQFKNSDFAHIGMFDITYDDDTKYKVTSTEGYAIDVSFYGFIGADIVVLPNTLTAIGDYTFNFSNFNYITIPSSVTTINYSALLSDNIRTIYNKTGQSFDWCYILEGTTNTCSIDTSDGGVTGVVTLKDNRYVVITN